MSLDLKMINQFKDMHLNDLIRELNGQYLPDIDLSEDGYVKKNKAFLKVRTKNVILTVNETTNAYIMRMKDIYLFVRSQEFRYDLWFVPIKATLDVEVSEVGLDFEILLQNTTLNYTDPKTNDIEERVIPQIRITKADIKIDPKKMRFNIGGSIFGQIIDIILPMFSRMITVIMNKQINDVVTKTIPNSFNREAIKSNGFFILGDNIKSFRGKTYGNFTFDYQLEHMDFGKDGTLNLAFNGTTFNNFTTGYRHLPNVSAPEAMPYFDPQINSTWQLFISTFLIEHAFRTLTDEAPVEIYLPWNFLVTPDNHDLMITTDAVEALFPFATQEFGNMIPVDINLKIARAWDWVSVNNNNNGSLTFKVDLIADGMMHLPDGKRHKIGTAEFYNGSLSLHINIINNTVKGMLSRVDFESCYISPTYRDIERYEATPFVINIIVFGALEALKK
jgi:hypothetical protein